MKSFKNFINEELKGLQRPVGRFAAQPIAKTDAETGKKTVVGDYPQWRAPTGGREAKAGRETWAVQDTIDKNNKRIGAAKKGVEPKSRTQISGVDLKPYRRGG